MVGPSRFPGYGIGWIRQLPVRSKAIDPFAGAGAGGFSLRGTIPGSRQDGVHIQRGFIPILSLAVAWIRNNGKPSLINSEIRNQSV